MKHKHQLARAVLTSTLLVVPFAHAATVISTVDNVPKFTSVDGDIQITPTGQLNTIPTAITIDSPNATITLDPFNIFPNAIISATGNDILVTDNNAIITIGQSTGIDSPSSDAIATFGGTGLTLTNSGFISALNNAVVLNDPFNKITNTATGTFFATTFFGLSSLSSGTVDNSGLFTGTSGGAVFSAGASGVLTNNATGTIQGGGRCHCF